MIYPLSNAIVTQYFGEHPDDYLQYGYPGHNGVDLVTGDSPPTVYAFSGGRCLKVGWEENGYGKYIVIELGPRQFYYCHLEEVYIKPGDQVSEGDPIAKMGSTGNSTGPHLHFGIRCTDGGGLLDYQGFMDPISLLRASQQPTIHELTLTNVEDNAPAYNKPSVYTPGGLKIKQVKGQPITRGRKTIYPRMKYY